MRKGVKKKLAPKPKERKPDGQPCRMERPDDIENPHNVPSPGNG
jgi:hypothetical protein